MLMNYSWPGNIRELGAVVDRAVILGNGKSLEVATALGLSKPAPPRAPDNEPTFYEVIPEARSPMPPNLEQPKSAAGEEGRIESLNESIKRAIERALLVSSGQIEGKRGAANALKINPHTLRAKMRKLGIRWSDYRRDTDD
jgi:DNA-binding NtrC family response regulator